MTVELNPIHSYIKSFVYILIEIVSSYFDIKKNIELDVAHIYTYTMRKMTISIFHAQAICTNVAGSRATRGHQRRDALEFSRRGHPLLAVVG